MNIENIRFNKSAISAGDCLTKGWEILKPNYFMFFGIGLIALVLGCIPVVSWIIGGPIMVGVYYAMLRQYNGEPVEFGMISKGFSKFVPAMVIGFLMLLPGIVINGYNYGLRLAEALAILNPNEMTGGLVSLMAIFSFLVTIFSLVGGFILGISLTFSLPLLAEHDLSLMEAIKLSSKAGWGNVGGLSLLFLLIALMLIVGALACCIGIFFVFPMIYAAITVAYRQVFPNNSPQQFNPPTPGNYGNMAGQSF